ncbi:MAG: hypothetical protein WCC87_11500 [Candidatus Korobacteraceae bacterium]
MKPIKYLLWVFLSLTFVAIPALGQRSGNCVEQDGSTRPDCVRAIAFFEKLQAAVQADKRNEIAAMIQYPTTILVHDKPLKLTNEKQFLANYDLAFNSAILCAIGKARGRDIWGNWQGFTFDGGEIWWDGIIPPASSPDTSDKDYWTKYPFKIITINNEAVLMEGCPHNWPQETKTHK